MPDEISVNLNGQNVIFTKGMDVQGIKSKQEQAIAHVFDVDGDNVLSESELNELNRFASKGGSIFNYNPTTGGANLSYKADDYSAANWRFDENNRCIESEADIDGDGQRDYHRTYQLHENGQIREAVFEDYENGTLTGKAEAVADDQGKLLRTREESYIYSEGQLRYSQVEVNDYVKEKSFSKTVDYENVDDDGNPEVRYGISSGSSIADCVEALGEEELSAPKQNTLAKNETFVIELGMNYKDFFNKNMGLLEALPHEQKQKIANFWQGDEDRRITNEIELAVLQGFTSEDGRVKMPEGNPDLLISKQYSAVVSTEDGYETKELPDETGADAITETYRSEAPGYENSRLVIERYNSGIDVRATWQHDADADVIEEDVLCDSGDEMQRGGNEHTEDLADGYADSRFLGYTKQTKQHDVLETGLSVTDDNLDGEFEYIHDKTTNAASLQARIAEMFGRKSL